MVDIRMPPTHTDEGLRAALELRRDHPRTGVLVFSQYIETSYSAQLLEGGAAGVGYLLKDRVANVAEFTARCSGWPTAGPPWTRRWSASCSGPAGSAAAWPR